jgi:uncharacterized OsmC-like protein
MKATAAKQRQSELKQGYADNPDSAIADLSAVGDVDFENFQFNIRHPGFLSPAGLHELSGGDGTAACPVEIMLAGWAGCAGVTFAAVANSMRLEIRSCEITATGRMDFRGTLAVDKESPIGLTGLKMIFQIDSEEPTESIEKLVQLTQRYCVVHQTLAAPPEIAVDIAKK